MDTPDVGGGNPTPILHAEVQGVADSLIERGLLCRGGNEAPLTRASVPPLAMDRPSAVMETRGELRPVDYIYFALACSQALWYLERLPLEVIASRVTAARRQEGPLDLVEVFGRVQASHRLRRLFIFRQGPISPECPCARVLPTALQTLSSLFDRREDPTFCRAQLGTARADSS